jgi:S1-C subfamily serine protease
VKQNFLRMILLMAAVSFLTNALPAFAQQAMTLRFNPDSTFIIPELGAAVTQAKDTLAVTMMLPGQRSTEYSSLDLKTGDLVLAINGKSVKSAKKLRAAYDALKVGETVKLTIQRNGVSKTISYKKTDESKSSGLKIIRRTDKDGGDSTKKGGK